MHHDLVCHCPCGHSCTPDLVPSSASVDAAADVTVLEARLEAVLAKARPLSETAVGTDGRANELSDLSDTLRLKIDGYGAAVKEQDELYKRLEGVDDGPSIERRLKIENNLPEVKRLYEEAVAQKESVDEEIEKLAAAQAETVADLKSLKTQRDTIQADLKTAREELPKRAATPLPPCKCGAQTDVRDNPGREGYLLLTVTRCPAGHTGEESSPVGVISWERGKRMLGKFYCAVCRREAEAEVAKVDRQRFQMKQTMDQGGDTEREALMPAFLDLCEKLRAAQAKANTKFRFTANNPDRGRLALPVG